MANGLKVKPYYWLSYVQKTLMPKAEQHRRNYWKHGIYSILYLMGGMLAFSPIIFMGVTPLSLLCFMLFIILLFMGIFQRDKWEKERSDWKNLQPILKLTQSTKGRTLLEEGQTLREEWLSIHRIRAAQEDIERLFDNRWRTRMDIAPPEFEQLNIPRQITRDNSQAAQRVIAMADALNREQRELLNVILGDDNERNPLHTAPNSKPPDWHTNFNSVLLPLTGT